MDKRVKRVYELMLLWSFGHDMRAFVAGVYIREANIEAQELLKRYMI